MTDKLEDTSLRLKDEMDLYRKIMEKLWHNRNAFQKEKESMQEVNLSLSPSLSFPDGLLKIIILLRIRMISWEIFQTSI